MGARHPLIEPKKFKLKKCYTRPQKVESSYFYPLKVTL